MRVSPLERFLVRVEITPTCWLWTGPQASGYGQLFFQGRKQVAHRIAWQLAHGAVPSDGQCVLHRCDVPLCVRPSHLWLGSRLANMRDMARKGRAAKLYGNTHGAKRRTTADYEAIRARVNEDGLSQAAVAREFGIHQTTVNKIVLGRMGGPIDSTEELRNRAQQARDPLVVGHGGHQHVSVGV